MENADRLPAIQQREGRVVVEWHLRDREIRHARPDQRDRVLDHRQRFQPEEIHLQHPKVGERSHRELADDIRAFAVAAKRHVFRKIAIADDDSGGVHASVAREPFQNRGVIPELFRRRLAFDCPFQIRRLFGSGSERDVELVWNHLRDSIRFPVAQTDDAPDIAHHAFRFQFAEGDDLGHTAFAVFLAHVLQHFAAARFTEIDVDIRWRNAFRIEETLEEEIKLQRIDIRDPEHVRDH